MRHMAHAWSTTIVQPPVVCMAFTCHARIIGGVLISRHCTKPASVMTLSWAIKGLLSGRCTSTVVKSNHWLNGLKHLTQDHKSYNRGHKAWSQIDAGVIMA